MTADLVIRGGLVVDGRGGEPFEADVSVGRGRVNAVGSARPTRNSEVIDAEGLVVSPGFIDTHTHSDALPQLGPEHDELRLASVRQGVTTEIAGNCGFSLFPAPNGGAGTAVIRHLEVLFGADTVTAPDADGYRGIIEGGSMATNLASLVGHGTLRAAVVGFEDRPASADEISRMADLAEAAIGAGAAGLSTGLLYPPGSFADTDEVVALARVAASYGRPYATHIRNEMDGVADALREAITIGEMSGAAVHVSHLKAARPRNHGRMPELLAQIEAARAAGTSVTADIYPYTAGSTMLHALLPPWATVGGVDVYLRRLSDPAARDRIRADMADPPPQWQNFLQDGSWADVLIASAPRNPQFEGRTVSEIALTRRVDLVDAVCDLLIDEGASVTVVVEMAADGDMEACLSWPHSTIGSDGIPVPGRPHPRWAGSFARVLGTMVRERGALTLPNAVRKMTGAAAARFNLRDRGLLREQAVADLVVFDPARVSDGATYAEPLLPPLHIPHVLVNGVPVICNGEDTGRRPGRFCAAG